MNPPAFLPNPATTVLPPEPPVTGLPPALKVDRLVTHLLAAPLLAATTPAASTDPTRVIECLVNRRGGVGGLAKRTASVQRVASAFLTGRADGATASHRRALYSLRTGRMRVPCPPCKTGARQNAAPMMLALRSRQRSSIPGEVVDVARTAPPTQPPAAT
jgi:hypothetical protein